MNWSKYSKDQQHTLRHFVFKMHENGFNFHDICCNIVCYDLKLKTKRTCIIICKNK